MDSPVKANQKFSQNFQLALTLALTVGFQKESVTCKKYQNSW